MRERTAVEFAIDRDLCVLGIGLQKDRVGMHAVQGISHVVRDQRVAVLRLLFWSCFKISLRPVILPFLREALWSGSLRVVHALAAALPLIRSDAGFALSGQSFVNHSLDYRCGMLFAQVRVRFTICKVLCPSTAAISGRRRRAHGEIGRGRMSEIVKAEILDAGVSSASRHTFSM